jgi:uncharacterized protein
MRARDTPRLNVLRGVLADITNSSKTNAPVKDDLALLALLRKRISGAKQAIDQAQEAGRENLVESESAQLGVLEAYAGNIKTMSDEDIRQVLKDLLERMQREGKDIGTGNIMKECFGPGRAFDGHMVEKQAVIRLVKEVTTK